MRSNRVSAPGPFRASNLPESSRYELSGGHAVYCAPAGGSHAAASVRVSRVLGSDPLAQDAGVDPGFKTSDDKTMRAPDFAIGGVKADVRGWLCGAPLLAVEIASAGQDEDDLQVKIRELLAAGTQWVWVMRLVGPRRVEVYTADQPMRMVSSGDELHAPGALANPVTVDALFERDAALDVETRNVLAQHGYTGIDDVRSESREEGREEALRDTLLLQLTARFGPLDDATRARAVALHGEALRAALLRLLTAPTADEALSAG